MEPTEPTEYIIFNARYPKSLIKKVEEEQKKKHVRTRMQMLINILVERYEK